MRDRARVIYVDTRSARQGQRSISEFSSTFGSAPKASAFALAPPLVRGHRRDPGTRDCREGERYFAAFETALPADDTSFPAPWIVLQAASVVSAAMMIAVATFVFMGNPVAMCRVQASKEKIVPPARYCERVER